jgi:response regulator NasT
VNSVLIVSDSEKDISFLTEVPIYEFHRDIKTVCNANEARRIMSERDFDLCIANSPLPDEFGVEFALHAASFDLTQVILVVDNEFYDETCAKTGLEGVFVISKPVNRQILRNALSLAYSAYVKIARIRQENRALLQKIEDLRIIERAKCMLIQHLKMTEGDAHRFIEKQAMNKRITRKQLAKMILELYKGDKYE